MIDSLVTVATRPQQTDALALSFWPIALVAALVMAVLAFRRTRLREGLLERLTTLRAAFAWLTLASLVGVPAMGTMFTGTREGLPQWLVWAAALIALTSVILLGACSHARRFWANRSRSERPKTIAGAVLRSIASSATPHWRGLSAASTTWALSLRDERESRALRAADDSVTEWKTGRKSLLLCIGLLSLALLFLAGVRQIEGPPGFLVQFGSIYGFTILLASAPSMVFTWLLLALISGDTRIAAALRQAGDLAGRGLVVGVVIGVADFATRSVATRLGSPGLSAPGALSDWLSTTLGLSVTGSVFGFALSLFSLLDTACRSQRHPRVAWLVTPGLVFVIMFGFSAYLIDAHGIYVVLARDLTAGLTPIAPQSLSEEDIVRDWRYAFTGDQSQVAAMFPSPVVLSLAWTCGTALSLWTRWHRANQSVRQVPGSPEQPTPAPS